MQKYLPSKVAATCIYFARKCCKLKQVWNSTLEDYTQYKETDLKDIIKAFELSFGDLITFALNNFNDRKTDLKNKVCKIPEKIEISKKNYQKFDDFLTLNGIKNPY